MAQKAADRLTNDYNIFGYPTCFFDGGYEVEVGGSDVATVRNLIESSGARDVHEFDLSISLVWTGSGVLDIDVPITNNEESTTQNQGFNSPRTGAESDHTTHQITTIKNKALIKPILIKIIENILY